MTKMKITAGLAFFLNTLCFATYYAVAKEALGRIDPIIFTYFEMMTLAPISLVILLCSWRHITRAIVQRGILLGSTLCLALFTIAIALNYTTATSVAFFPAMNGFLAAVFAWLVLRQPIRKTTWLAGLFSLTGVVMLILNSSMGNWRGSAIAFLGGLFFTGYIFACDLDAKHAEQSGQSAKHSHWPLFGIELLTTAIWANLVMLLFGNWHAIHPSLPKDIFVILYVACVCTFLPTLIAVLMQRYISPVTVSFIYILEPVLGAVVSALYLGESLPLAGYAGGLLIVLGAIIHTYGSTRALPTPLSPIPLGVDASVPTPLPVGADLSCAPPIYRPIHALDEQLLAAEPASPLIPVGADLSCAPPIYRPVLALDDTIRADELAVRTINRHLREGAEYPYHLPQAWRDEPDIELFEEYPFLSGWGTLRPPLQRGTIAYSVARKGEKQLLQQRRLQRVSRLRLVESP